MQGVLQRALAIAANLIPTLHPPSSVLQLYELVQTEEEEGGWDHHSLNILRVRRKNLGCARLPWLLGWGVASLQL